MAKQVLQCSFCGRKKPETSLLIAGIDAHICDKCIEQAHGIVLEELKSSGSAKLVGDLILKKTKRNPSVLRSICYWSRSNQKSDVGCGLQSLQTFDATAIRRRSRNRKE